MFFYLAASFGFWYNKEMDLILLKQLGIAIVLASLIGLEREQKRQKHGYSTFGGIRTFVLIGLIGALSYILFEYSVVFFVALTFGFLGILIASYVVISKVYNKVGATSDIAAMLVYVIGMLSAMEKFVLATVITLITLSVLHFKAPLHRWAKHLKNEEIVSAIEFIVIAFIVLPMLPNESYGPYGFFNPYLVWLMVVFISAISYVSYVAIKIFGAKRGIGITGFLAGFISSTALAFSFSAQSKKNRFIVNPYVLAVIIASSAMFFRVLVEVSVLNRELLSVLAIPMLTMGITGIACVLFFWIRKEKIPSQVEKKIMSLKSPFSIVPAIKFGVFFALILFLIKAGQDVMGNKGIYLTSFISGILDVDAITVSMANLAKDGVSKMSAITAITIAAMTNTLVKGIIFMLFGNRKVGIKVFSVMLLMMAFGGISLLFVY